MQTFDINRELFTSDNFQYVEINKTAQRTHDQKKIEQCVKNAITLLDRLENSFKKSSQYENKLLKCRMLHKHCHSNDRWNMDDSDTKSSKHSNTDNFTSPRSVFDVTESWSTMSIVCLQYEYEELSKRYNTLLKAYNDACRSISSYDDELLKLRKQVMEAHEEIINMNKAILNVGNKYLSLKQKKVLQKVWFQSKIDRLKKAIRTILVIAERACLEINEKPKYDAPSLYYFLR